MPSRPRVLFLAHLLPYPLDNGGRIKSYHTLKALSAHCDVALLALVRDGETKESVDALRPLCAGGVQTVPLIRSQTSNVAQAASALLGRKSFVVSRDFVPAMQKAVAEYLQKHRTDVVHIDHLHMAQYVLPRKTGARLILDNHNVEADVVAQIGQTTQNVAARLLAQQEAPKLEQYETDVCRAVDYVLVTTDEDAARIKARAGDKVKIAVLPIGVDFDYYGQVRRDPASQTLLSIATMHYQPNVDGVTWFYENPYPVIKQSVPDVKLVLAGPKPPERIKGWTIPDKSLSVPGYVEDERTLAADCAVFIVPLLAGGGMRVKILNAMAMGLPVISTRVGAEGIGATDGRDLIIANSTENFSRLCITLLREPARRDALADAGRSLVQQYYSWDAIAQRLLSVYSHVLLGQ